MLLQSSCQAAGKTALVNCKLDRDCSDYALGDLLNLGGGVLDASLAHISATLALLLAFSPQLTEFSVEPNTTNITLPLALCPCCFSAGSLSSFIPVLTSSGRFSLTAHPIQYPAIAFLLQKLCHSIYCYLTLHISSYAYCLSLPSKSWIPCFCLLFTATFSFYFYLWHTIPIWHIVKWKLAIGWKILVKGQKLYLQEIGGL